MRGAELAPTSLTLGIDSGSGVVSNSKPWLNLVVVSQSTFSEYKYLLNLKEFSVAPCRVYEQKYGQLTYWGFRDAILAVGELQ